MFFDPLYMIMVLLPATILLGFTSSKIKKTFERYYKEPGSCGLTGSEIARKLLNSEGLDSIAIEIIPGSLSDHYDPTNQVLRLSQRVAYSNSISAISVAAHETGHALQHSQGYAPLTLRNALVPLASFGSQAGPFLVMIGLGINLLGMINLGIWLFGAALAFQVITLPVELDASNRALSMLHRRGLLGEIEAIKAKDVLQAAAMTYVASAAVAGLQLLYYILLSRRRD